jgi:hypothetical protein
VVLIYLEALYFMFKVIIIIDRIRKAKSIVAYLSCELFFRFSCPNFDSEKIRSQNEKKGVKRQ